MVELHLSGIGIWREHLELSNHVLAYVNGVFDHVEEHVHRLSIHLDQAYRLQTALKIHEAVAVIGFDSRPRDILETPNKRLNRKSLINLIYVTLSSAHHENKLLRVWAGGPFKFLLAIVLQI